MQRESGKKIGGKKAGSLIILEDLLSSSANFEFFEEISYCGFLFEFDKCAGVELTSGGDDTFCLDMYRLVKGHVPVRRVFLLGH